PGRPRAPSRLSSPALARAPVRADPVGAHHLAEDSLAQAPVGDAQPFGGEMRPDRLEDGAAREDQIGALMPDAGVGGALGVAHRAQTRDRRVDLGPAEPQGVDRAPIVARQVEMDARDGGDGAGGAEKVEAIAALLVL